MAEQRYLAGKNGKQYPIPPWLFGGMDDESVRMFSIFSYGRPDLNGDEQDIYDLLLPIIQDAANRQEDQTQDRIESLDLDDFHERLLKNDIDPMDAESLAYEIAETLVERGYRLTRQLGPNPLDNVRIGDKFTWEQLAQMNAAFVENHAYVKVTGRLPNGFTALPVVYEFYRVRDGVFEANGVGRGECYGHIFPELKELRQ